MKHLFIVLLFLLSTKISFAQNRLYRKPESPCHIMLAGKDSGEIKKSELLEADWLGLECSSEYASWKISSWRVALYGKGVSYREFELFNDSIPTRLKERLKEMNAGNKICVEYIKLKSPDNQKFRSAPPITFTITE